MQEAQRHERQNALEQAIQHAERAYASLQTLLKDGCDPRHETQAQQWQHDSKTRLGRLYNRQQLRDLHAKIYAAMTNPNWKQSAPDIRKQIEQASRLLASITTDNGVNAEQLISIKNDLERYQQQIANLYDGVNNQDMLHELAVYGLRHKLQDYLDKGQTARARSELDRLVTLQDDIPDVAQIFAETQNTIEQRKEKARQILHPITRDLVDKKSDLANHLAQLEAVARISDDSATREQSERIIHKIWFTILDQIDNLTLDQVRSSLDQLLPDDVALDRLQRAGEWTDSQAVTQTNVAHIKQVRTHLYAFQQALDTGNKAQRRDAADAVIRSWENIPAISGMPRSNLSRMMRDYVPRMTPPKKDKRLSKYQELLRSPRLMQVLPGIFIVLALVILVVIMRQIFTGLTPSITEVDPVDQTAKAIAVAGSTEMQDTPEPSPTPDPVLVNRVVPGVVTMADLFTSDLALVMNNGASLPSDAELTLREQNNESGSPIELTLQSSEEAQGDSTFRVGRSDHAETTLNQRFDALAAQNAEQSILFALYVNDEEQGPNTVVRVIQDSPAAVTTASIEPANLPMHALSTATLTIMLPTDNRPDGTPRFSLRWTNAPTGTTTVPYTLTVQSVAEATEGVFEATFSDDVNFRPMQDYLIDRRNESLPVPVPTSTLSLKLFADEEPLDEANITVTLEIAEVQGVPDAPTENTSDFVAGRGGTTPSMAKLWADRDQSTPVEVTRGSAAIATGDQVALLDEAGDHYWVHVIQAADEPSEGAYGWVKMQYVDAPEESEGEGGDTQSAAEPSATAEAETATASAQAEEAAEQQDEQTEEAAERATERVENGDE
jgi:hypothetical protein